MSLSDCFPIARDHGHNQRLRARSQVGLSQQVRPLPQKGLFRLRIGKCLAANKIRMSSGTIFKFALRKPFQFGACVLAIAFQVVSCWAECVEVQPHPWVPFESSAVVRLTVVDKGKPAAGAKLEFYLFDSSKRPEEPALTLVSDEFGWIKSPKLSDGRYKVIATAEHNLRAELFLDVSSHYGNTPSAFKMELLSGDPLDANPEPATIEHLPIASHLEVFRGTVTDQSGAGIPGAHIGVFRRGPEPTKVLATLNAGKAGEFEARLDPGIYIAEFRAPGFATKLVGFEIVSFSSEQMAVTLVVGSC